MQSEPYHPTGEDDHRQHNAGGLHVCPVCGEPNQCRIHQGCLYKGACWCKNIIVPAHILRFLTDGLLESSCLCRRCLTSLAAHAHRENDPERVLSLIRQEIAVASPHDDFYLDELGRTVFTSAYHLRRGFCCKNGCRHCPYPLSSA